MRVCEYCGAEAADGTTTCPHCSSTRFFEKCPRCGGAYKGTACPTCAEADRISHESAQTKRAKAEAEQKANQGLGWKTALTVFLPFIGGYFLVNEHVKRGFRVFGMVWCALVAIMAGTSAASAPAKLLASLLCLAPIGLYLYKTRERLNDDAQPLKKLPALAFAVVLVIAVIADMAPSPTTQTPSESAASAESTAPAVPSSSSAASAARTVSAKDVVLTPTTEYLEYSDKKADAAALVKASASEARITAETELDLDTVGAQAVTYRIAVGVDTATQDVGFTVRDTKAPAITLSNAKPSIDQGGSFDPQSSISSVTDPVDGNLARVEAQPEAQGAKTGVERFYDAGWYLVDGTVDPNTPGTYSLLVKASDKHGNTATKEILVTVNEVAQAPEAPAAAPAEYTYVANKNSKKFHLPNCRDVSAMKESNKQVITATRQQMIEWGYVPCKHCNP